MTATMGTNSTTEVMKDSGASPKVPAATVLACAWPALLLATVCLLPYLNKPFNIDDPHFLAMAQQIVKHPTHPMDFTICWNTTGDCRKAYTITPGNTLMGYVLVPTVLTGAHEWTAHLTQLVLVWIAVVAMASLVLRLGWDRQHAIAGALLLGGHPTISPHGKYRNARYSRDGGCTRGNGTSRGVESRTAVEPRRIGCRRAGATAGFRCGPTLCFFFLSRRSSCWTASIPGRIWAQVRRQSWLWSPVCAGAGLLLAPCLHRPRT